MTVMCPELNYLEAKRRKEARRPWRPHEDKILRDYAGVDPKMLTSMLARPIRTVMARQRELGLRGFASGRRKVA